MNIYTMGNKSKIFIDSNFFIALFNPVDGLNKAATKLSKLMEAENFQICVTNLILAEVVTVLSLRAGREIAIDAGRDLLSIHNFIYIDAFLSKKTWEIFQKIEKKNVGFVDCSILAVMESESIDYLLTFDVTDFRSLQKPFKFKLYPLD